MGARGGFESEGKVEVWAELAGVKQESIEIFVEGGSLVIKGWRGERIRGPRDYYQVEIFQGPFERKIDLPVKIDADKVSAFYDEGMLKIVLPKAPPREGTHRVQVRTITIT
jgi:HSP20 family protein